MQVFPYAIRNLQTNYTYFKGRRNCSLLIFLLNMDHGRKLDMRRENLFICSLFLILISMVFFGQVFPNLIVEVPIHKDR